MTDADDILSSKRPTRLSTAVFNSFLQFAALQLYSPVFFALFLLAAAPCVPGPWSNPSTRFCRPFNSAGPPPKMEPIVPPVLALVFSVCLFLTSLLQQLVRRKYPRKSLRSILIHLFFSTAVFSTSPAFIIYLFVHGPRYYYFLFLSFEVSWLYGIWLEFSALLLFFAQTGRRMYRYGGFTIEIIAMILQIAGFTVGLTSREWKENQEWNKVAKGLLYSGGSTLHLSVAGWFYLSMRVLKKRTWKMWIIPAVGGVAAAVTLGACFIESGEISFLINCGKECLVNICFLVFQYFNYYSEAVRISKSPRQPEGREIPIQPDFTLESLHEEPQPPTYEEPQPPTYEEPQPLTYEEPQPATYKELDAAPPYRPPQGAQPLTVTRSFFWKPYFAEVLDLIVQSGTFSVRDPNVSDKLGIYHDKFTPIQQFLLVMAWFEFSTNKPTDMEEYIMKRIGSEFYEFACITPQGDNTRRTKYLRIQRRSNMGDSQCQSELDLTFAQCKSIVQDVARKLQLYERVF